MADNATAYELCFRPIASGATDDGRTWDIAAYDSEDEAVSAMEALDWDTFAATCLEDDLDGVTGADLAVFPVMGDGSSGELVASRLLERPL